MSRLIPLLLMSLLSPIALGAAEINGKVTGQQGESVQLQIAGGRLPAVGDKVEVYLQVPGLDEPLVVATGAISAVDVQGISMRIDQMRGRIETGLAVRITSSQGVAAAPPATGPGALAGSSSGVIPAAASVPVGSPGPVPATGVAPVSPPRPLAVGQSLELKGHKGAILAACFSSDGRRAFTACSEKELRIWNTDTGEAVRTMTVNLPTVSAATFSGDGRRALVGAEDGMLALWDVEAGRELRRLPGHDTSIRALAFSPDGAAALSGAGQCSEEPVPGTVPDADGQAMQWVTKDLGLRLWDVESGAELRRFTGHTARVSGVVFTSDGRTAISSGREGCIRVWDVASGRQTRECTEAKSLGVLAVAVSPDGARAVMASGEVRETDPFKSGGPADRDAAPPAVADPFGAGGVPQGEIEQATSFALRHWDLRSGRELQQLKGHSMEIYCVDYSADGRRVASGAADAIVAVWDAQSGRMLTKFPKNEGVSRVAFDRDGSRVICGTLDGVVRIWRIAP